VSARIARFLLAAAAIGLSALPFLLLLQLGVDVVKIYGGLAAFAGLVSLIPLAIAELAFVIAVGALLGRAQRKGRLVRSFLFVCGIELLLLPAIEVVRFAIYAPITGGSAELHRAILRPAHLSLAAAGLGAGAAALAAAAGLALRGARRPPGPQRQRSS
jgi:hypothetical protein